MTAYIQVLRDLLIWLIALPLILGTLAVLISRSNKSLVVELDGFKSQLIFGWLGIIIHELSHLILALLFGHRIGKVSLIRFPDPHNPQDNSLGYVSHSWNEHNYYQRAGNLFIGIAPVIGCSISMAVATRYLAIPVYNFWQSLAGFNSPVPGASSWWQLLLWLLIVTNISIGGFDLSSADLQNSRHGLLMSLIFVLLLAAILTVTDDTSQLADQLQSLFLPIYACLGLAIAINMLVCLFLHGRRRRLG